MTGIGIPTSLEEKNAFLGVYNVIQAIEWWKDVSKEEKLSLWCFNLQKSTSVHRCPKVGPNGTSKSQYIVISKWGLYATFENFASFLMTETDKWVSDTVNVINTLLNIKHLYAMYFRGFARKLMQQKEKALIKYERVAKWLER